MPMKPCRLPWECGYGVIHDEEMESAPKTQLAAEPPPPAEAEPGHRFPCIWTQRDFWVIGILQHRQIKRFFVNLFVFYLICVMAREKGDIICSKVVADLLDFPVTFPFPPLGSPVLEPNLFKERNTQEQTCFRDNSGLCRGQGIY